MTTANDNINSEFVTGFVEFCACRGIDPEAALQFLVAQDWKAGNIGTGITEEQLEEVNRLLKDLAGDPTMEQTEAIFKSVLALN